MFTEQLFKIVEIGNAFETHLYPDPEKNIADFQKCADYFIEKVDGKNIGMDHEWRLRRIISRLITFVPLSLLFMGFAFIFWGAPVALSPATLLLTGLSGFGVNIFLHRFFLFLGRNGKHYTQMKEILLDEIRGFKNSFGLRDNPSKASHTAGCFFASNSMLKQEYAHTIKALRDEIQTDSKTDVIVIIGNNDAQQQNKLRMFVEQSRGSLIRSDVPVIFVSCGTVGKTVEGVSEAFALFEREAWRQTQEQYPKLKNKSLSQIRAVFVLAGGSNFDNIFTALRLPVVPELKRPLKTIELALINGYRASGSLAQEGRCGVSLVFGDGALIGPAKRKGDITLVGTWSSYSQMTDQGFGLILVDDYSSCKVRKFYEKMNIELLKPKLQARSLDNTYNFDNKNKRQFLGLAGMIIFSFDDKAQLDSFTGLLKDVSCLVRDTNAAPQAKLISDFMIPLIMKANGENIYTYMGVKLAQYNNDAARNFFTNLFGLYEKRADIFDVKAYVPYHRELFYTKISGNPGMSQFDWLQKARCSYDGGRVSAANSVLAPGGIDFRFLVSTHNRIPEGLSFAPSMDRAALVRLVNMLRQQELNAQPTDARQLQMFN